MDKALFKNALAAGPQGSPLTSEGKNIWDVKLTPRENDKLVKVFSDGRELDATFGDIDDTDDGHRMRSSTLDSRVPSS